MRKTKKMGRKKNKGSVLAYILTILSLVMTILVSLLIYINSQIKFSLNRVEKEKAFQVAEAGIYYYKWYLNHETSGKTPLQVENFWENGGSLGFEYTGDFEGIGQYSLEITPPSPGSTIVFVKSSGSTYKNPNLKRTVRIRLRRQSWSEYMFLTNESMHFGTYSTVYGKMHSNSGIRFDGISYNLITSSASSYKDGTHGGNTLDFGVHTHVNPADPAAPAYPWPEGTVPDRPDVFTAGRSFPVPEVSFSGVISDLANMKARAQGGNGVYFDDSGVGREIFFKENGTFDVCTVDRHHVSAFHPTRYLKTSGSGICNSCEGDCLSNRSIPDGGVIFVENNAWVGGKINGKRVTVVAANLLGGNPADIFIGLENIRYSAYDCSNIIGLVAQRNITVVRDCQNDLIIDAALLAQTGRVGRNDYGSSNKATLTFNGAIVSYLQPYFNHGVNGFGIRIYNYDNNLLYCPPPDFPTGNEYAIDLWEEL